MESITVRYEYTPWYIVGTIWAASLWSLLFFSALAAFFGLLGLLPTDPSGATDLGLTALGVALLALFWVGTPLVVVFRWHGLFGQPVAVAFSDDGIRQDMVGRQFQGDWSTVTGALKRGPFLLVKLRGGGTLGLPIRAFASPAQAEALLGTIQRHIAASKNEAANRP